LPEFICLSGAGVPGFNDSYTWSEIGAYGTAYYQNTDPQYILIYEEGKWMMMYDGGGIYSCITEEISPVGLTFTAGWAPDAPAPTVLEGACPEEQSSNSSSQSSESSESSESSSSDSSLSSSSNSSGSSGSSQSSPSSSQSSVSSSTEILPQYICVSGAGVPGVDGNYAWISDTYYFQDGGNNEIGKVPGGWKFDGAFGTSDWWQSTTDNRSPVGLTYVSTDPDPWMQQPPTVSEGQCP
jgi:hypothetical protein